MKACALAVASGWVLWFLTAGDAAASESKSAELVAEGENDLWVARNVFQDAGRQAGEDPLPTGGGQEVAGVAALSGRRLNYIVKPIVSGDDADVLENPAVHRVRENDEFLQPTAADRIVASISPQAQSNGETLFNGPGGIPSPLSARFLTAAGGQQTGFVVGPTWVEPSLGTGAIYRSQSGGGGAADYHELYATVTPAVSVLLGAPEAGAYLSLHYQGVLSLGDTAQGHGVYDQSLDVAGTLNFAKLSVGASLQASQLSGADQDFGGTDVDRLLLSLSATGSYRYSERTKLDLTLSVPIREYEQGDSSQGVNSQAFLNWDYSPITSFGAGLGLGALVVEGRTQFFEQALLRLGYVPSPKLSFQGTFGCEFRDAGDEEEITPIFRLGAVWQSLTGTSVALSGERSIFNSAAESGTNYVTTSISLTATQRMGRYLVATGSVGFNDNEYSQTIVGKSDDRSDQYFMVQAGLAIRLHEQWKALLNGSYGQLVYSGVPANDLFGAKGTASSPNALAGGTLHLYQSNVQLTYDF